jgi:hypothetical protein
MHMQKGRKIELHYIYLHYQEKPNHKLRRLYTIYFATIYKRLVFTFQDCLRVNISSNVMYL